MASPLAAVLVTPVFGFSRRGAKGGGSVTKGHFDSLVIKNNKVPRQREEGAFVSTIATNSSRSYSLLRLIVLSFISVVAFLLKPESFACSLMYLQISKMWGGDSVRAFLVLLFAAHI